MHLGTSTSAPSFAQSRLALERLMAAANGPAWHSPGDEGRGFCSVPLKVALLGTLLMGCGEGWGPS